MIHRRTVRALFAEDRHAEANPAAIGFAALLTRADGGQVDGGDRAPHWLRAVTAVEVLLVMLSYGISWGSTRLRRRT